jgi:hypothetical protein
MAKSNGLGMGLLIGSSDLSGDVGVINNISTPVGALDITGINKSAHERLQGLVDGIVGFNTYFNDATGAAHLALRAPFGTASASRPLTIYFGADVGDAAFMADTMSLNYDGSREADGMLTFDVELNTLTTLPTYGVMLTSASDTHTGATNGTTVDQGAQTTAGAEAILHVTSFTGSNFTATVQDSSNGSSWGTLKAFTQVTDIGTERVTVSGTVERYVRVISTGTFNPVTFAVSFRRGTATDRVTYS